MKSNGVVQWWSTPRRNGGLGIDSKEKNSKWQLLLISETYSMRKKIWILQCTWNRDSRRSIFWKRRKQRKNFIEFIDRYVEKELPKNPKGYAKQKMLLTSWKSKLGSYFLCHITPAMIAASPLLEIGRLLPFTIYCDILHKMLCSPCCR